MYLGLRFYYIQKKKKKNNFDNQSQFKSYDLHLSVIAPIDIVLRNL
jgi:hypothetical protein